MVADIKVVPEKRVIPGPGMTPAELRIWRAQRPGSFTYRHGTRPGWTQKQAAEWAGVGKRTWEHYEAGTLPMPLIFIKRLQDYPSSLSEVVDRMWMTAPEEVEENQGVHPELKHEKKPNFEDPRTRKK